MKKMTRKLVLRRATVRVLSDKVLTHVIGGQETVIANGSSPTGDKMCGSNLVAALDGVARDRV